jgi:hypothetical protein
MKSRVAVGLIGTWVVVTLDIFAYTLKIVMTFNVTSLSHFEAKHFSLRSHAHTLINAPHARIGVRIIVELSQIHES